MFPSINYYICKLFYCILFPHFPAYRLLHPCKGIAQGQGINESDTVVAEIFVDPNFRELVANALSRTFRVFNFRVFENYNSHTSNASIPHRRIACMRDTVVVALVSCLVSDRSIQFINFAGGEKT